MIVENIESTFNFGKYKGETIKEIALKDPNYIEWLCKTVELFVITNETIDELNDYCLSIFFNDPEKYLNEEGNFTRCSWQHLKFNGKEITIGSLETKTYQLKQLINEQDLEQKKIKTFEIRFPIEFSRQVFDGEICKKNLIERNKKNL